MPAPDAIHLSIAFAAAFVAGGVNSVAGGGTMLSFPTLVALGVPPLIANATNTVGIWPGSIGSIWGFRRELARVDRRMAWLLIPSVIGGLGGAILLRITPPGVFDWIVPWLVLFATVLFIVQAPVRRRIESYVHKNRANMSNAASDKAPHGAPTAAPDVPGDHRGAAIAMVVQLFVGIYGGYFGAGISIIMLAVLGIIGMTDILEMNAMTSVLSGGINGVAGLFFVFAGLVRWPYVATMAIGSIIGGYTAAGVARKIGKTAIRRFIICVGLTIAVVMFYRVMR